MLLRGVKNQAERKAFNSLRKALLAAGLKSELPMTVKEYEKRYEGAPKKYAREDYYFNWSKQMRDFYNKLGKKVQRKIDKNNLESTPRTTFDARPGSHEGRATTLKMLEIHLKTLVNIANPNYLKGNMNKREREKLVTSNSPQGPLRAGKKSTPGNPVTIKDFGGSLIRLAYNNYLTALSELGYTETLRTVLSLTPDQWNEIFLANKERLEPVFVYSYMSGSGSDEAFNAIFKGDKDYMGDVVFDDMGAD